MKQPQIILLVSALLIMGVGAGWLIHFSSNQNLGRPGVRVQELEDSGKLAIQLPSTVLDYVSEELEPSEIELQVLPDDTTLARRLYTAPDGMEIMLSVVLMGTDRTSIHKPEYCLTSQAWQILDRSTVSVEIAEPAPYSLPMREFTTRRLVQRPDGSAEQWGGVYLFWFVADGRLASGHYERLAEMTWDLLRTGTLSRWAYISCFATCTPGEEKEASARVQEFIAAAVPEFQTTVGKEARVN